MFFYSSYHLNISFPSSSIHLNNARVVTGDTQERFCLNNSKTHLFVLVLSNYAARGLLILFNTFKRSLLKSSYPKKILAKFSYAKKSWNRKLQTKKILRLSPSLELPSTPPGMKTCKYKFIMIVLTVFHVHFS